MPQLAPGAAIGGRYQLVRPLGAGGMGAVYEVIDQSTNRRRALKLLHAERSDPAARARFRREATVSGRVESDFVVEVVDAGYDPDLEADFLVMELLRGNDLGAVLSAEGTLPEQEVVRLLAQVALAMDKVHAEGVIHRDLKPENLFLTDKDDGTRSIKILDFGVAKVLETGSGGVHTTQALGTPLYMAPEQLTGDALVAEGVDLYALGHVAYTLLVGAPYWEQEFSEAKNLYPFIMTVVAGVQEAASVRAKRHSIDLPGAFDAWFQRSTAKEPEARFESATQQVVALAEVLGVEAAGLFPSQARRTGAPRPKHAGRESVRAVVTSNPHASAAGDSRRWRFPAVGALLALATLVAWLYLSATNAQAPLDQAPSEPAQATAPIIKFPAVITNKTQADLTPPGSPPASASPNRAAVVTAPSASASSRAVAAPARTAVRSSAPPRAHATPPPVPAPTKRATSDPDDPRRKQPAQPEPAYDPLDSL